MASDDRGAIARLLEVTETSSGALRGSTLEGRAGRAFGGHTLALAIAAASTIGNSNTVPASMHALFLRPVQPGLPIDFTPSVVKRGRSIDVIDIQAAQADRTVLTGLVSFRREQWSEVDFQGDMPRVPSPDDLPATDFSTASAGASICAPFDVRLASGGAPGDDPPEVRVWLRLRESAAAATTVEHAALLTFASDLFVNRGIRMAIDRQDRALRGASIDHSIWFHRPFAMDDWLLIVASGISYASQRSLSIARMFDRSGHHVATCTQEALLEHAVEA